MSISIARIAGIPVRLHASFLLLPLVVVVAHRGDTAGAWSGLWLIGAVFACVALHELGHATIAGRFGIKTVDITLYPTGGIARLEHHPAIGPELWIAIAGPAVNAVIVAGLAGFVLIREGSGIGSPWAASPEAPLTFWSTLLWVNLSLLAFNLVPAYPMDGGRVFRALVARHLGELRATIIAVRVGQILATMAIGAGLVKGSPWLVVLGIVVLIGAAQQARAEQDPPSARVRWAHEAMRTDFTLLSPDDTLESASCRLLEGSGSDFPVVDGSGKLLGVLSKPAMLHGLAAHGPESTVARAMVPDVPTISPDDDLRQIAERVASRRGVSLLVVQNGTVIGVIPAERVAEFEVIEGLDLGHAPDETIAEGLRRLEH